MIFSTYAKGCTTMFGQNMLGHDFTTCISNLLIYMLDVFGYILG